MLDAIHLNKSNHSIYYKQICMVMSDNIDSIFCADKKLAHSYSYHVCTREKVKSHWRQYEVKKHRSLLTEWDENEDLCKREGDRKLAAEEVWRLSHVLGSLFSENIWKA